MPNGNRHADMAPHSGYPCVGGDGSSSCGGRRNSSLRAGQELDATAWSTDPRLRHRRIDSSTPTRSDLDIARHPKQPWGGS